MKQCALVAGAAGLIGSHLCELLLAKGLRVLAVDNLLSGSWSNIEHLQSFADFRFIRHDICQPLALDEPVQYVYNLACPASPDDFHKIPLEILFVCASGNRNLLDLARSHQASFLFTSTSEVYGDPLVHPQVETYWGNVNSIGERSCYDEGKRFAESLITNYHRLYQVPVRIVRVFNTYGPRMRANDGRVIPNFIMQALNGESLTLHGNGHQTRSFCYVGDLVAGIYQVMMSPQTIGQVYNLGNPHEYTIHQLALAVCQVAGVSPEVIEIPSPRRDDPARRQPNISKVQAAVGWEPLMPLHDGLQQTLAYFKQQVACI